MKNKNKCSENKDGLELYSCMQISDAEVSRLSQQLSGHLFSYLDSGTLWCASLMKFERTLLSHSSRQSN